MNRKRKMIILCFIIIFIFVVLPIIVGYYNIDKKVPSSEKMNAILYMIFIMTSVYIIPLVIFIIVGISVAKSKFSRLDKNDFVKNQEYYREIINNYSVASLAYIDNFKVDDSILVATLMELERKNIIECKEKIIMVNEDVSKLTDSEMFIVQAIKDNNLNKFNYRDFEEIIKSECKKEGLLQENKYDESNKNNKRILNFISYIIPIILILVLVCIGSGKEIVAGILFVIMVVLIFTPCIQTTYAFVHKKVTPYLRTETAKEINSNLEGIKRYLEDFSKLEEKGKDALTLWNQYLIYSVMFRQNYKIVEEYMKKIL